MSPKFNPNQMSGPGLNPSTGSYNSPSNNTVPGLGSSVLITIGIVAAFALLVVGSVLVWKKRRSSGSINNKKSLETLDLVTSTKVKFNLPGEDDEDFQSTVDIDDEFQDEFAADNTEPVVEVSRDLMLATQFSTIQDIRGSACTMSTDFVVNNSLAVPPLPELSELPMDFNHIHVDDSQTVPSSYTRSNSYNQEEPLHEHSHTKNEALLELPRDFMLAAQFRYIQDIRGSACTVLTDVARDSVVKTSLALPPLKEISEISFDSNAIHSQGTDMNITSGIYAELESDITIEPNAFVSYPQEIQDRNSLILHEIDDSSVTRGNTVNSLSSELSWLPSESEDMVQTLPVEHAIAVCEVPSEGMVADVLYF
jgi:hypothetical protein